MERSGMRGKPIRIQRCDGVPGLRFAPSGLQCDRPHHIGGASMSADPKWKHDGVRVIPANSLDPNTAQTPGMDRKAAINFARAGAHKIWAGTVLIRPNAKTGAHHHGELESIIYVVSGRARMR